MKEVISGVIGSVLTAGIFWAIGIIGQNVVMPAGAILGVAGPCPIGWTEYTAAKGKYLLGADGDRYQFGTDGGRNTLPMKFIGEVTANLSTGESVITPKQEDYSVTPGSGGRVNIPFEPRYFAVTMCQKR